MNITSVPGMRVAVIAIALALAACAGGQAEGGTEDAAVAAGGAVEGTPAGGLARWVADVRAGLDTLPALAARAPAAARNEALLLYVGRQEYIEIYYGTAGRALRDPALSESVMAAEAAFHELLRVANTTGSEVDAEALGAAVRSLSDRYEAVLARAREAGVALAEPPLARAGG